MLGVLCSFAIQAQEKTEAEMIKEAREFYEYQLKIENFKKLGAKGTKSNSVPRPPGLDPSCSMGGEGNIKSWELYRKTVGNMMAKEEKPNNFFSKRTVNSEKKENSNVGAKNSTGNVEIIPNFGTGANQTRDFTVEGSLGNDDFIDIIEEEDNHALSTTQKIELVPNTSVFIAASLENLEKGGELSADHDVYEFETKPGAQYFIRIGSTAEEPISKAYRVYDFDEDRSFSPNRILDFGFVNEFGSYKYVEGEEGKTLKLALLPTASGNFTDDRNDPDQVYELSDETTYTIAITEIVETNVNTYQLELQEGDVFGVAGFSFEGISNSVSLESADEESFIKTDGYGIFPIADNNNPLPTAGSYGFHYVIPKTGTYFFKVSDGFGGYNINGGVSRPGLEERSEGFPQQIIFLNYAGTELGIDEFFEIENEDDFIVNLSPLSSFMTNWGLEESQTRNLSRKITRIIEEKLNSVSSITGGNQNLTIISDNASPRRRDFIRNFLDNSGIPYSRIIIGGTVDEILFTRTIGLASSIDVGNFDLSDNGFVLLDILSEEPESPDSTINKIPLAEGVKKIDLVAEVVGDIAAHEAGHFLGNWHADNSNEIISTMDQGGEYIGNRAGVVEGDAFGDEENIAVTFVKDVYTDTELFEGLDETDINTAYALSTGTNIASKGADPLVAFMNKLNHFENPSALPTISSYPNPQRISEIGTLAINSETASALSISLFDMQGRKISDVYTGNTKAGELLELSINPAEFSLGRGVYFYKIVSDLEQKSHKFVIE